MIINAAMHLLHNFWGVSKTHQHTTCGQSYIGSMIVNYNSRVVLGLKIPHITTLD